MRCVLIWLDLIFSTTSNGWMDADDDDEKETVCWQIWWQNVARPKPAKVTFLNGCHLAYSVRCARLCTIKCCMRWVSWMNEMNGVEWDRWLITFGGNFFIVSLSSLARNSLRFSVTIGVFIHNFYSLLLGTSSYCLSDLIMLFPFIVIMINWMFYRNGLCFQYMWLWKCSIEELSYFWFYNLVC